MTIRSKYGKNGGNVFNIKRELSLSYVLARISTKRLIVGLFKKRWMYCHTQFAGGNNTLVFGEDSLVTKQMRTKAHEMLQGQD